MNIVYSLNPGDKGNFAIFDIVGKKLAYYELSSDKKMMTISDINLENGIYFYNVTSENKNVVTGRFVVIK
ncbi:MAG: T9SS type A sorting domain-containing protein [Bacteroidetes bacterium]|nr:T9SS type A sorting domain-containing protein [Bacteroidota bacterium]